MIFVLVFLVFLNGALVAVGIGSIVSFFSALKRRMYSWVALFAVFSVLSGYYTVATFSYIYQNFEGFLA